MEHCEDFRRGRAILRDRAYVAIVCLLHAMLILCVQKTGFADVYKGNTQDTRTYRGQRRGTTTSYKPAPST